MFRKRIFYIYVPYSVVDLLINYFIIILFYYVMYKMMLIYNIFKYFISYLFSEQITSWRSCTSVHQFNIYTNVLSKKLFYIGLHTNNTYNTFYIFLTYSYTESFLEVRSEVNLRFESNPFINVKSEWPLILCFD